MRSKPIRLHLLRLALTLVLLSVRPCQVVGSEEDDGTEPEVRHRKTRAAGFLRDAGLFSSEEQYADNKYVHEVEKGSELKPASEAFPQSVVLFYSAECGHCQQYASTWRKIAKALALRQKG